MTGSSGEIQYAEASRFYRRRSGIPDHPLSRTMTGVVLGSAFSGTIQD
jgi:hypothetical protein